MQSLAGESHKSASLSTPLNRDRRFLHRKMSINLIEQGEQPLSLHALRRRVLRTVGKHIERLLLLLQARPKPLITSKASSCATRLRNQPRQAYKGDTERSWGSNAKLVGIKGHPHKRGQLVTNSNLRRNSLGGQDERL